MRPELLEALIQSLLRNTREGAGILGRDLAAGTFLEAPAARQPYLSVDHHARRHFGLRESGILAVLGLYLFVEPLDGFLDVVLGSGTKVIDVAIIS